MQEIDIEKIKSTFVVGTLFEQKINDIISRSHGFSQFSNSNDELSYIAILIAARAFNLTIVELDHFLNCNDNDFQHDFNGIKYNFPDPETMPLDSWNGFVPYCAAPPVKGLRPAYLPERIYINQECYFLEYCDEKNVVLMKTDNALRKSLDKSFYKMSKADFVAMLDDNEALDLQGYSPDNSRVILHDVDLDKYPLIPINAFMGKCLIIDNKNQIEYLSGEFNVFTRFTLKRIEDCYQNDDKMYLGGELRLSSKEVAKEAIDVAGDGLHRCERDRVVEGR